MSPLLAAAPPGRWALAVRRLAGRVTVPRLRSVVLDTTDARGLAEFYRELLGYEYRPGDEPPASGKRLLLNIYTATPGSASHDSLQMPATWAATNDEAPT